MQKEITLQRLREVFLGRLVTIERAGQKPFRGSCTQIITAGLGIAVRIGEGNKDWYGFIPRTMTETAIEGETAGLKSKVFRMSIQRSQLLGVVLAGHHSGSAHIRLDVEVGGRPHSIWGHYLPNGLAPDHGVVTVELRQHHGPLVRPEAEEDLRTAGEKLVLEGVPFCTVMHLHDADYSGGDSGVVLWDLSAPPPLPPILLPPEPAE